MDQTIRDIEAVKTLDDWDKLEKKYSATFAAQLNTFSTSDWAKIDKLLVAVARNGNNACAEIFVDPILEKRKMIDWKSKAEMVNQIVDAIKANAIVLATRNDYKKNYFHFVASLIKTLATDHEIEKHFTKLFEIVELAMRTREDLPIHSAAQACATQIQWRDCLPLVAKGTLLVVEVVKANESAAVGKELTNTVANFLKYAYQGLGYGASVIGTVGSPEAVSNSSDLFAFALPHICEFFKLCVGQLRSAKQKDKQNFCSEVLKTTMQDVLCYGSVDQAVTKPIIADLAQLWTCGELELEDNAGAILVAITNKDPSLVLEQMDTLLDRFVAGKEIGFVGSLLRMYELAPQKFEERIDGLLNVIENNHLLKAIIVQVLTEIAKRNHRLILPKHIESVATLYKHPDTVYLITVFMDVIATTRPDDVLKHEGAIISSLSSAPLHLNTTAQLLTKLATKDSRANAYVNMFINYLKSHMEPAHKIALLQCLQSIAANYPKPICKHRIFLNELMKQPMFTAPCQQLVEVLERHNSEDEDDDQAAHANAKNKAQQANGHSNNQKQKPNVPNWSHKVCQLLNQNAEHDWKSLATHLGYSNDDIRNWATQSDPCLSLLDDWFATHKTREATYAVYRVLLDINRTDAATIVDDALKSAQNAQDDDDDDKAQIEAQPIFLSYQWAHQQHVKLLKQHLSLAGYAAWMDIGQMGGGDKLFTKIDAALRAAKVVVCCVTDKYAQSTNCNREVTLAVTLGKPIIPLLLEDIKWPPTGALGPILSENLYIEFCKQLQDNAGKTFDNKTNGTDTYWQEWKFSELLMQLRYTHPPDTKLITSDSPYKSWWLPSESLFGPRTVSPNSASRLRSGDRMHRTGSAFSSAHSDDTCAVFLSYQVDTLQHVKLLYQRLTSLGYSCWLDIMQMGGDEALNEKAERAVRSSNVVVCCVSQKYALSANCRRQVRLADEYKKPLVPLLLEAMQWPPEGALRHVFAPLSLIDFSEDINLLTQSKCTQFDELVSKIELSRAKSGVSTAETDKQSAEGSKAVLRTAVASRSRPSSTDLKLPSIKASAAVGNGGSYVAASRT